MRNKKCPGVVALPRYDIPPPTRFWHSFPSNPLPTVPDSPIHFKKLSALIDDFAAQLADSQLRRAQLLLQELRTGVHVPLQARLPGLTVPNSYSVCAHGESFTDTVAHWVSQKIVAGPFVFPPCHDFRVNQMLAVEQHDKVRLIMNLSAPDGASFNDMIIEDALEKVHMSTARQFGYTVYECGRGARMWKWDMCDAYKNLPAKSDDLRLQGFKWLGRYFVETKQAFGAKTAVAAFDRLGRTISDLAAVASGIPRQFLHRTLDDLPIVTPAKSPHGPAFADQYRSICEHVNIKLAPLCPDNVKAFEDSCVGTVLGIRFDTTTMHWSISHRKYNKLVNCTAVPLAGGALDLDQMRELVGLISDFCQMCLFARGFRHNILHVLGRLCEDPASLVRFPPPAVEDLKVIMAAVQAAVAGLPIPRRPRPPPINAVTFVSDAAGARFARVGGRFIPIPNQTGIGAASVSALEDGPVWFCCTVTWPEFLLLHARDAKDHAYGCKSPTLEAVALILPLLCCPEQLVGQEVVLLTDNEAVVYGWDSRKIANDESASIFIRALHILSFFLGCVITVQHLPRLSTASARLADALTRVSTTTPVVRELVQDAPPCRVPRSLLDWLEQPFEDWSLPYKLLQDVEARLSGDQ